MFGWIRQGLRTGIVTTCYPARTEPQPVGVRNRLTIDPERLTHDEVVQYAQVCPTGAIVPSDGGMRVDLGRCIQCGHCVDASGQGPFVFVQDYELSVRTLSDLVIEVDVP